jgi:hypothetical protein
MSSGGRTKGARSQVKVGFDNTVVFTVGGGKTSKEKELTGIEKKLFIRQTQPEEKYEVLETLPQREIILNNLEDILKDLLPARYWEYKKWWTFVFCTISACFGVGGCLWALGETVLFADQEPSMARLGAVCILFLPFLCWIKVVFLPHGQNKQHLDAMTAKRAARRREEYLRNEHLEGRLPRPVREIEIPDAPYVYNPDEPWLYVRWKPPPKVYHYIDENGLAQRAEPGSEEEIRQKEEEKKMQDILASTKSRDLIAVALAAMEKGEGDGEGKDAGDNEAESANS